MSGRLTLHTEVTEQTVTPFYYYDMDVLDQTLEAINRACAGMPCTVHYAVKANGNLHILREICSHGLGADLVSGGEIEASIEAGFMPEDMNFSGVGKTDAEIRLGLKHGIGCFNVESTEELEVIDHIAGEIGKTAPIAIRVNPNIDAHTHKYVTTGTSSNKFGIGIDMLDKVVARARALPHVRLTGLHFHIGSQITTMEPFVLLCETANKLIDRFEREGIRFDDINVGGGLGIDYKQPNEHQVADFEGYFGVFREHLRLREGQHLHFELGRAVVAQCGSLISRVVFVKDNGVKKFAILDAGMNNLIRPALYDAHHSVENLTSAQASSETYDVVGPVCESSDVFAHDCLLPPTRRGDLIAIRSAGAYCESMASTYNMRPLAPSVFHRSK